MSEKGRERDEVETGWSDRDPELKAGPEGPMNEEKKKRRKEEKKKRKRRREEKKNEAGYKENEKVRAKEAKKETKKEDLNPGDLFFIPRNHLIHHRVTPYSDQSNSIQLTTIKRPCDSVFPGNNSNNKEFGHGTLQFMRAPGLHTEDIPKLVHLPSGFHNFKVESV